MGVKEVPLQCDTAKLLGSGMLTGQHYELLACSCCCCGASSLTGQDTEGLQNTQHPAGGSHEHTSPCTDISGYQASLPTSS